MRVAFLIVVGASVLAGVIVGLLDVFVPGRMIRWQVASTARSKGSRHEVGKAFGRFVYTDDDPEPWNDATAKRKVRVIGIVLIGSMLAIGMALLAAAPRS